MKSELIERARIIAHGAHAGQTRRDGKAYITHPESVVANVQKMIVEIYDSNDAVDIRKTESEFIQALAWLHDVVEDTNLTVDEVLEQIEPHLPELIGVARCRSRVIFRSALMLLTREPEVEYRDYINGFDDHFYATVVKLADLRHNLSDLNQGSRRSKYLLSYQILNQGLRYPIDVRDRIDCQVNDVPG